MNTYDGMQKDVSFVTNVRLQSLIVQTLYI